jgi:hypothetical protein
MADYSNLSAADYLRLSSGDTAFNAAMEGEANKWRRLTGRSPTFSLGASGTSSMLKSYMSQREDEILAAILEKQREAISTGVIEREHGGGVLGWNKWWKKEGLPAEYAARAREAFESIQGQTRAEASRLESEAAAGYAKTRDVEAKARAARDALKEDERLAAQKGISDVFNQYSRQYRIAAESVASWTSMEAAIRDQVYKGEGSDAVKNAIFEGTIKQLRDAHDPVERFEVDIREEGKKAARRQAELFPLEKILKADQVRTVEQKAKYEALVGPIRTEASRLSEEVVDQASYLTAKEKLEAYMDELAMGPEFTDESRDKVIGLFKERHSQYAKPRLSEKDERSEARRYYDAEFRGFLGPDIDAPNFAEWLQSDQVYETTVGKKVLGWQRYLQQLGVPSHYARSPALNELHQMWQAKPAPVLHKDHFERMLAKLGDALTANKISRKLKEELEAELRSLLRDTGEFPPGSIWGD